MKLFPSLSPSKRLPILTQRVAALPRLNVSQKLSIVARGALGLVPAVVTGILIVDTMRGDAYETQRRISEEKTRADWRVMLNNNGHWSGFPAMDYASDRLKALMIYGPFNLFEKADAIGTQVNSFFSNVLLPNSVPIAISIAGLYLGFGAKVVHAPFKAFWRWLHAIHLPEPFVRKFKNMMRRVGNGVWNGLCKLAMLPFKSLHHFGFTVAGLSLLAFIANRFHDVYTESAEEQFFRPQILGMQEPLEMEK